MKYEIELEFAMGIAREGGAIMKRYFRAADIDTQWKSDSTPLTVADTTINQLVIDRVKSAYPAHGVHGEEASYEADREYVWICDPVDGTMPYSLGLPISTFSLGLLHDGQPVLGVVYDPFEDRLFSATAGGGAQLNGSPIHVSDHGLTDSYVDLEMLTGVPGALSLADLRAALVARQVRPFSLFSFIMGSMLVASGQLTAAIFAFNKPEDLGAAKIIVEEAGGRVTDVTGRDQLYNGPINGAVVSNGVAHDEVLQAIASARVIER
ncbi:MAG TPA: inositol monophosphatase [Candidatus Saccharimonadia bacterium]